MYLSPIIGYWNSNRFVHINSLFLLKFRSAKSLQYQPILEAFIFSSVKSWSNDQLKFGQTSFMFLRFYFRSIPIPYYVKAHDSVSTYTYLLINILVWWNLWFEKKWINHISQLLGLLKIFLDMLIPTGD